MLLQNEDVAEIANSASSIPVEQVAADAAREKCHLPEYRDDMSENEIRSVALASLRKKPRRRGR